MLIGQTIKDILWILYQELPDLVPKHQDFIPSIYVLLYDASCTYLGRKDPDLTQILPLADVLSTVDPIRAENLYKELLKRIDSDSRSDKTTTFPVAQKLAQFYFEKGLVFPPTVPNWQEQQRLFFRSLTEMENSLGYGHSDVSRFCFMLGESYIDHGLEIDAERIFLRLYRGQRKVLGDKHSDTLYSMTRIYNYYIDEERYLEAEALIQKIIVEEETINTDVTTPNDTFVNLRRSNALQAKLASLYAPGKYYYWEDSRIYLEHLDDVSLVPSLPPDFFPRGPVQVTVHKEGPVIHSSRGYDNDPKETLPVPDHEFLANELRVTESWDFLKTKAEHDDWSIFDFPGRNVVRYEQQTRERSASTFTPCPIPGSFLSHHSFWIFLEDQKRVKASQYLVSSHEIAQFGQIMTIR